MRRCRHFQGVFLVPLVICSPFILQLCKQQHANTSAVKLGLDLTLAVMALSLAPGHTCWVKILRGPNEAWGGLWKRHSSMSQDSRLWQGELPSIWSGTAALLVTKRQARSGTLARRELRSSCGRRCSMNSASPAGVSCAGHSRVSYDPSSAMGWNLPVEKELSLEGWAENPANCMVESHKQQSLFWLFVCLPPRESLG